MSFEVAFGIAMISGVVGAVMFFLVKPEVKRRTNKKYPKHICNLIGIVGFALYISFLICLTIGKHQNPTFTYEEVPIEKLTATHVYFDDNSQSLSESYVILEKPNEEYSNVVVVETERYILQWISKIELSGNKYHVYLSEDIYNRLQDGSTIYESK